MLRACAEVAEVSSEASLGARIANCFADRSRFCPLWLTKNGYNCRHDSSSDFDFDGLIFDSETPDYISWQETYAEFGVELPLAQLITEVTNGAS